MDRDQWKSVLSKRAFTLEKRKLCSNIYSSCAAAGKIRDAVKVEGHKLQVLRYPERGTCHVRGEGRQRVYRILRMWWCASCFRVHREPNDFKGIGCDSSWLADRAQQRRQSIAILREHAKDHFENWAGLTPAEWRNLHLQTASLLEQGLPPAGRDDGQ
jgi:hypothetical protein